MNRYILWILAIPLHAANITVCSSGCDYSDLQLAINAAVGGDRIIVTAGQVFDATREVAFNLPKKPGSSWITIESSLLSTLPEGYRVTPDQAASMPKICITDLTPSGSTEAVFFTANGSHHWKLLGLEIANCTTGLKTQSNLIEIRTDSRLPEDTPHHIVIDRCWIHGYAYDQGPNRGIRANGDDITITNSWIDEIHYTAGNQESHAIAIGGAGRSVYVRNNTITSSTEASFTGGGRDVTSQRSPSDVVYKGNWSFRPGSYAVYTYDQDPEGTTLPTVANAIAGQTWSDTDDM